MRGRKVPDHLGQSNVVQSPEVKSYASGPTIPLIEKTIGQVFDDTVAKHSGKAAIVSRHQGLRLSYAELSVAVNQTAAGLWGLGIRPGDGLRAALSGSIYRWQPPRLVPCSSM